jgi:hypothetical protein
MSGILCVVLFLGTIYLLVRDARAPTPEGREFLIRTAMLLLPPLMVAAGIGWGRGYENGFKPHYATLMIPGWITLLACWSRLAPSLFHQFMNYSSLVLLAVATGYSLRPVVDMGRQRQAATHSLSHDILAGRPIQWLAATHSDYWRFGQTSLYAEQLTHLRRMGKGLFGAIQLGPDLAFTNIAPTPTLVSDATACDDKWDVDRDSQFLFSPASEPFQAVRITFTIHAQGASAYCAAAALPPDSDLWRRQQPVRRNVPLVPVWDDKNARTLTVTFVLDRPASTFVFLPHDRPARVQIRTVEVAQLCSAPQ